MPPTLRSPAAIAALLCLCACLNLSADAQFEQPGPISGPWESDCKRSSRAEDKDKPPKFICLYEATVTRMADCSARVEERIVLPHRFQNNFFNRSIWAGALQDIKQRNILVIYNGMVPIRGQLLKATTGKKCGHGLIVVFDIRKGDLTAEQVAVPTPVQIKLTYVLEYGIMQASRSCGPLDSSRTGGSWSSVLRWTSGMREDTVYDYVNVTFVSETGKDVQLAGSAQYKKIDNENKNAEEEYARVSRRDIDEDNIEQSEDAGLEVWKSWRNVSYEIEVFATESGGAHCNHTMWCIRRRFVDDNIRYTPTFFAICSVLIFALVAVLVSCFCVPCCTRSKTMRRQRQQHQHGE